MASKKDSNGGIPSLFWAVYGLATAVKLMLIPAYFSTDFEVHRNWLAITNSLPLKVWYIDDTSEWTLDYPPFFAWFEWLLSHAAKLVDPEIVEVENLDYASHGTVVFQRVSVILTDIVLAIGIVRCLRLLKLTKIRFITGCMLMLMNVGLIFVDNIHFQYNGFLFGILLLSVSYLIEDRCLMAAFFFAALLNFKHIFLYIAPAFGIYLLKFYCFNNGKLCLTNLAKLLVVGLAPFAMAFGPFWNQIPQVLKRLFPFGRGLTHAYWAPNFWAFYNSLDLILSKLLRIDGNIQSSTTSGLVQQVNHVVLPNVTPLVSLVLTITAMVPITIKFLSASKSESKLTFLRALVLYSSAAFLFGWHVHEKAILITLVPLSILFLIDTKEARYCFLLSIVGYFSLFPLLFVENLLFIRYSLYLGFLGLMFAQHIRIFGKILELNWFEWLYALGFIGIPLYEHVVGPLLGLNKKLPFLPLLLTSFYCSLGVIYFFISYNFYCFRLKVEKEKKKHR